MAELSKAYLIFQSGGNLYPYNESIIDDIKYPEEKAAVLRVLNDVNMRKCMQHILDYNRMSVSSMAAKLSAVMGDNFGTYFVKILTEIHGMPLRNDLEQPPQQEEETTHAPEAPTESSAAGFRGPNFTLAEDAYSTVTEQLNTGGFSDDTAVPHVGLYSKVAKDYLVARVNNVFPTGFWKTTILLTVLWGVVTHDTVYVTGKWCDRMEKFLNRKFGALPDNGLTLGRNRSVSKMIMEKTQAMRGNKSQLPTFVRPSVPWCEAGNRLKAMISIKHYPVNLIDGLAFFSDAACAARLVLFNKVPESEPEMFTSPAGSSSAASATASTSSSSAPPAPSTPASANVDINEPVNELPKDLDEATLKALVKKAIPMPLGEGNSSDEGDSSDEDDTSLAAVVAAKKVVRAAAKASKKRKEEAAAAAAARTDERPRKRKSVIIESESEEDEAGKEAADEAQPADKAPTPPCKRKVTPCTLLAPY